jgi:hypothetical protein
MPIVRATIAVPYELELPSGDYPVDLAGASIALERTVATSEGVPWIRTSISWSFNAAAIVDGARAAEIADREARKLVRYTNRLLRWYRQLAAAPTVVEVTRTRVSPVRFTIMESQEPWVVPYLDYAEEPPVLPSTGRVDELGNAVRQAMAVGNEPDVGELNLLDAEYAKNVGRFREAVLLCWSVIDSAFVRKFNSLLDQSLAGEWGETRDFLKGLDFGLRHKMTSGLRLLVGRSLFDEPDGFWEQLSTSYRKRNGIIHEGLPADEDDAGRAIGVARKVIDICRAL